MEIPSGQSRRQERTLGELVERHHGDHRVRAAAFSWIEIPNRVQKVSPLVVTEDGTLHVYDAAGEVVARLDLAGATTRDDGTTVPSEGGVARIRGPIDPFLLGFGTDARTTIPELPVADLGGPTRAVYENLAVVAWRPLRDATGVQDIRLDGRPSVHAEDWRVSVSAGTAAEVLPAFLRRAGAAGWELVAAVPAGSIEQNAASEAWLGALNLRDTRFERTLVQLLYLRRRLPDAPGDHARD